MTARRAGLDLTVCHCLQVERTCGTGTVRSGRAVWPAPEQVAW